MKLIFAFLVSLLTAVASFGQAFEGQITYANSFKSKLPAMTDQQWGEMMGVSHEYYVKGGSYKTLMNGKFMQWQLFPGGGDKLYTKAANSEAALWNDVTAASDEILKTDLKKGAAEILGYKCDVLVITGKNSVQTYYFSPRLGMDAKLFAKHKYGNWYEYLRVANAVPLKMVFDSPQFLMECTATRVKPGKLEAGFFDLPAGLKTEKSPY